MALNHLCFQGRFVEDPKFGDTKAGNRYANFRLAWSEKYKEQETKCFLECKAFGSTAQFMEKYMNKKGQEIITEGKLTTDEWTTDDGQKRSKIVMMVTGVHFCGKKTDGDTGIASTPTSVAPASSAPAGFQAVETDELPF